MKDELKQSLLFAHLDEAQLERVIKRSVRVRLQEGEGLFEQGDRADRFYLVESGQIKLYRLSPAGNEKIIDIVRPGSTFAEALMFLDSPRYPVGAQALQPAQVISIDAADYADMLRNSVDLCFLLMGEMSQRLRALVREIDDLSLQSATSRVAAYFLAQLPREGDRFELGLAKQVIASRLSVKPETFSRIIKNLHTSGILTVSGARVTVHDREGLRQAAAEFGS
jgi:CRP-like cAMP-binding protein